MSKPDEHVESLELIFKHLKILHATVIAVMTDVASLRYVVLKERKISRNYRRALAANVKVARPLAAEAMKEYNETLKRLGNNGNPRNRNIVHDEVAKPN